jgi:hypothetical protein
MPAPRNTLKKRLGPGVWEDAEGGVHFSIPEILKFFYCIDTPETRAETEAMLKAEIAKQHPQIKIIIREGPD